MADALGGSVDGDDVRDSADNSIHNPSDMGYSTYSNSSRTTSSEGIPTWYSSMDSYERPNRKPKERHRFRMLHS